MIPEKVKSLIDKFCMGVHPTEQQQDMIMDLTANLDADPRDVAAYMKEMISGPTREQREAAAKAEAARRAREEKERREREEAERKAEAARRAREEKERRDREEAARRAEAARKAREEQERKEREIAQKQRQIIYDNNNKANKYSTIIWKCGLYIGIGLFLLGLCLGWSYRSYSVITAILIIGSRLARDYYLSSKYISANGVDSWGDAKSETYFVIKLLVFIVVPLLFPFYWFFTICYVLYKIILGMIIR